jgi:hypothetical protein
MLDPCENLRIGGKILADSYRHSTAHFADERAALWHAIMAYNTGSLYAGEDYVQSVVAAALGSTTPEVPSIAILRGSGPAARRVAAITEPGAGAVSRLRVNRPQASPRFAPLLAHGLDNSPRGIFQDTLKPALSH